MVFTYSWIYVIIYLVTYLYQIHFVHIVYPYWCISQTLIALTVSFLPCVMYNVFFIVHLRDKMYLSSFFKKNFPITPIFVVYTCSVHITGLTSRAGLGNFDKCPISKTVIATKKMITGLVVISIPFKKGKEHKEKWVYLICSAVHLCIIVICGNIGERY